MGDRLPNVDTTMSEFVSRNEIFADLLNDELFEGREIIQPENLQEVDSTYKFTLENGEKIQNIDRLRDVVKRGNCGERFVILAVEDQLKVNYAMPLRVMTYDAIDYVTQCREFYKAAGNYKGWTADEYLSGLQKDTRLAPCYTLVLYLGEKPWDGPRSLSDMLSISPELEGKIADYPLNLVEVREGEEGHHFKNLELNQFFQLMHQIYHKKAVQGSYKGNVLRMAGTVINSEKLYQKGKEGDGEVKCIAVEELWEEGAKKEREQLQPVIDFEKKRAEAAEKKAKEAEAEKQRVEAEKQRVEVEKQRVEAEKQRVEAEKQRVEVEKQQLADEIESLRYQLHKAGKSDN